MVEVPTVSEVGIQSGQLRIEIVPPVDLRTVASASKESGGRPEQEPGRCPSAMINFLVKLIESLRDELKNYGEMLALLDRQQEFLLTRAVNEVSQSITLVTSQGAAIHEARERRERCRRDVAGVAGKREDISFADLIPDLPSDYQPLLKALVDENNELLSRVRRRARQNHLMLKRSVELMQQVLNSLRLPGAADNAGGVNVLLPGIPSLQEEAN
jgi:flagellar biosynthesis/type III secretory pathway chaperone